MSQKTLLEKHTAQLQDAVNAMLKMYGALSLPWAEDSTHIGIKTLVKEYLEGPGKEVGAATVSITPCMDHRFPFRKYHRVSIKVAAPEEALHEHI